jgi:hypothetical protein
MTSHKRKISLIESGLKQHKCEVCYNSMWNNKPIPIELHHLNGDSTDNSIENLQIICPNCHAQTENYKSKNRTTSKHGKNLKEDDIIKILNTSFSITEALKLLIPNGRSVYLRNLCKNLLSENKAILLKKIKKEKEPKKIKQIKLCIDCGCVKSKKGIRCTNCRIIFMDSKIKPPMDILVHEIQQMGYLQVGRKYGVSDNTVRKWIRGYSLNPKEIRFKNYKLI